jgi:hypothetical protein
VRSRFPFLIFAVASFGIAACSTVQDGADLADVRTNFVPEAKLSKKELRDVVKLANQCGIDHVTEVYTYCILPTSVCGIGVKSQEKVQGREVTCRLLFVNNRRWAGPPEEASVVPPVKELGKFWTTSGVSEERFTTSSVCGNEAKVVLEKRSPLSLTDQILKAFAEGRVRYENKALRDFAADIDFSKPKELKKSETGKYSVSFQYGYFVEFTFHEGVVIVSEVARIVS